MTSRRAALLVALALGTSGPGRAAAETTAPKPVSLRFDGGYAGRRLFALGVTGTDVGVAIGRRPKKNFAWWITPRLAYGGTDNGLDVWAGRLGSEIDLVYEPIHFGMGASVQYVSIGRAARPDAIAGFGLEARGFVQLDLVRDDDYALFLRGTVDGGNVSAAGAMWGGTIAFGVELGVYGKRPAAWTSPSEPPPPAQ